jgi:hypothetical protein
VTAAKEGTVELHVLQLVPLSVENLYSSVLVPVPPLPAVILTVSVAPAHTIPSTGFLVSPGATGSATTVHVTSFVFETHPEPVLFLLLYTLFVPVTEAKEGIVELHGLHVVPLLVV